MSKLNKLFLITSVVAGLGHFRAGRHFSDKGEVLSHDALTEAQWDQVKKDPRLVVTEAEPDKETAQVLADEVGAADAEAAAIEAQKVADTEAAAKAKADAEAAQKLAGAAKPKDTDKAKK